MASLTTKGWVIKEGVILTGALAEIFDYIIYWLNDETKNTIDEPIHNSQAIVRIWLKFGEVFCEVYVYTQNNKEKEIIHLQKALQFPEHIDELKILIGENEEISNNLIYRSI